jgi:hypothetical protein
VLLVVYREDGIGRRNVGNVGISRGRLHDTSGLSSDKL